jgi:hypothetical protein
MNRQALILGGVVATAALSFIAYNNYKTQQEVGRPVVIADLPKFSVGDDVDKVTIKDGKKDEIVLEKKGDKWELTKPVTALANQDAVKGILSNLKELKINERVDLKLDDTVKKAKHLDEEQVLRVAAFKGAEKKADLFIGESLLQVDGKPNDVYKAKSLSRYLFAKETKDWRDKEIFKFENDNAIQVAIKNKNGEFSFTKGDKGWAGTLKGAAIERFDESKLKDLLLDYKSLSADDFGDGKADADTGLGAADGTVTITLKDNAGKYLLNVGKVSSGDARYAKKDGSAVVFVIGKSAAAWATAGKDKFQKVIADAGADAAKEAPKTAHHDDPNE